jgi:serine/threonine-protein kinase HipA
MQTLDIHCCPGTLAEGFDSYSRTCLKRVFQGKKVHHILPYDAPFSENEDEQIFEDNRKMLSMSGVQEKFSVVLEKNKLRLTQPGERGQYILKPIPRAGKKADQIPANEHLTMQIARQVYNILTAENALIFFKNGPPAYITKRFDVKDDGTKWAQDDFASLANRTPQSHGEQYKYTGNYLEIFQLLEKHLPTYRIEAQKLIKILIFNYLFSNGDAHFKNFSLLETALGDYCISPAYDMLNTRIHIEDNDFALVDGLLPRQLSQGKIIVQFGTLADMVGIQQKTFDNIVSGMISKSALVKKLTFSSFLDESLQRNYWQSYQTRLNQLTKPIL